MNERNPAYNASRRSWECVQGGDREGWLSLMADDVCIEDPIGKSPLDATGLGHRGAEAAAAFWDKNIGPNTIQIEPLRSFTGGKEVAHLMTLTTTLPAGMSVKVTGIFTYAVNDEGKIKALRGFWEMSDIEMV